MTKATELLISLRLSLLILTQVRSLWSFGGKEIADRGCARGGHGVIGVLFAKMNHNFVFWGVIHDLLF